MNPIVTRFNNVKSIKLEHGQIARRLPYVERSVSGDYRERFYGMWALVFQLPHVPQTIQMSMAAGVVSGTETWPFDFSLIPNSAHFCGLWTEDNYLNYDSDYKAYYVDFTSQQWWWVHYDENDFYYNSLGSWVERIYFPTIESGDGKNYAVLVFYLLMESYGFWMAPLGIADMEAWNYRGEEWASAHLYIPFYSPIGIQQFGLDYLPVWGDRPVLDHLYFGWRSRNGLPLYLNEFTYYFMGHF